MKREELFERLVPPPFGLERLRVRMDAARTNAARRLVVVSVFATAVIALFVWPRPPTVDLVGRAKGLLDEKALVTGLDGTVVEAVPSANPQVVFARVASME